MFQFQIMNYQYEIIALIKLGSAVRKIRYILLFIT